MWSHLFVFLGALLALSASEECPRGSYNDGTGCSLCPLGTFQPLPGKAKCVSCPARMWTVQPGSSSFRACIGPTLKICDGANFTGTCKKFHDNVEELPFKIKSIEILDGAWMFYKGSTRKYYLNSLSSPYKNPNFGSSWRHHFTSFESHPRHTFCYMGKGENFASNFDNKADVVYDTTDDGRPCVDWKEAGFPEVSHQGCRNPTWHDGLPKDRKKPWCFTREADNTLTWRYCNVPRCVWDQDCYNYNNRGIFYEGTNSVTKKGYECAKWSSNFPHAHPHFNDPKGDHNYARNEKKNLLHGDAPWCYTTCLFRRWDYTSAPQCDRDDHPFYEDVPMKSE